MILFSGHIRNVDDNSHKNKKTEFCLIQMWLFNQLTDRNGLII